MTEPAKWLCKGTQRICTKASCIGCTEPDETIIYMTTSRNTVLPPDEMPIMRNGEHSRCTSCGLQSCAGCPHETEMLDKKIVARAAHLFPSAGIQYAPGTCPSCKHPQHVGKVCGAETGTAHFDDSDGTPMQAPIRCPCEPADAIKQTNGKVKGWRLFPWEVMGEILDIFNYGISKGYLKDSWRNVDPKEYEEALMRHVTAPLRGETHDPESGKRHMAHAAWNTIVLLVLQK